MLHNMSCEDYLLSAPPNKAVFLDPPDNLGLSYGVYKDNLPANVYYAWLENVLHNCFVRYKVIWLSYYHRHDLRISAILEKMLRIWYASWNWRKILWRFTFGQYRDTDFPNGYRILGCFTAHGVCLNYDSVRVVSERMLLGDPRAVGFRVPDDVWEIPRVTGNSPERRSWHPTQHPEELLERIIKLSCNSSETFVDLFGGTGTSLRVCNKLGVNCEIVEIDPEYVSLMKKENVQ